MDERFFATAVVALILALLFGGGLNRPGPRLEPAPIQSARAGPPIIAPARAPSASAASAASAAAASATAGKPSLANPAVPRLAPAAPVLAAPKT